MVQASGSSRAPTYKAQESTACCVSRIPGKAVLYDPTPGSSTKPNVASVNLVTSSELLSLGFHVPLLSLWSPGQHRLPPRCDRQPLIKP